MSNFHFSGAVDILGGSPFSSDAPNFAPADHPKAPTSFWGDISGPYPTNAWFHNFVLDSADQLVQAYPFTLKGREDGLSICVPDMVRF